MLKKLSDPVFMTKFHAVMTIFWLVMTIPALLFWKESILYVILISQWANVAAHWSSFQAAHSEKAQDD